MLKIVASVVRTTENSPEAGIQGSAGIEPSNKRQPLPTVTAVTNHDGTAIVQRLDPGHGDAVGPLASILDKGDRGNTWEQPIDHRQIVTAGVHYRAILRSPISLPGVMLGITATVICCIAGQIRKDEITANEAA